MATAPLNRFTITLPHQTMAFLKNLSLYILLVLLFGCNHNRGGTPWVTYRGAGLKTQDQLFETSLMLNERELLFFGSETIGAHQLGSGIFADKEAVICKSTDGGKTWQKQTFSLGGAWHVHRQGASIYAAKVTDMPDRAYCTVIYKTYNKGLRWDSLARIEGYLTFMQIGEDGTGGILKRTDENRYVFYRVDSTFKTEKELPLPAYQHPVIANNNLLFFMPGGADTPADTSIGFYNLTTGQTTTETLPDSTEGYYLCPAEKLWFICRQKQQVCLYRREQAHVFTLVKTFESDSRLSPEKLFVTGKHIALVLGQIKGMGFTYEVFTSDDGGLTWQQDDVDTPFEFLCPTFVLSADSLRLAGAAYALMGRVTVRQHNN